MDFILNNRNADLNSNPGGGNENFSDIYENYNDLSMENNTHKQSLELNRRDSLDSNILPSKKLKINDNPYELSKIPSFVDNNKPVMDFDDSNKLFGQ